MFLEKCPMCGKRMFDLRWKRSQCPRCGASLSATASVEQPKTIPDSKGGRTGTDFQFPVRTTHSLEDDLKKRWSDQFGGGETKASVISESWNRTFADRPFDMPFYTALNGRACILIYFSSQNISGPDEIVSVLQGQFPMAIQAEMVLPASYPIVWCAFIFPDDYRNPLILETWMDVLEGNFQDFCSAAYADEHVDILIEHQDAPNELISVGCRVRGLAPMLKREVARAIAALPSDTNRADFVASVEAIEGAPNSGGLRVHLSKAATLQPCGKAKNQAILYRDVPPDQARP